MDIWTEEEIAAAAADVEGMGRVPVSRVGCTGHTVTPLPDFFEASC